MSDCPILPGTLRKPLLSLVGLPSARRSKRLVAGDAKRRLEARFEAGARAGAAASALKGARKTEPSPRMVSSSGGAVIIIIIIVVIIIEVVKFPGNQQRSERLSVLFARTHRTRRDPNRQDQPNHRRTAACSSLDSP